MATTKSTSHTRWSSSKKTDICWPGYEHVAGARPGTKGSCKPKAHQTKAEKKADSRAAAATKLRKTGH